MESVNHNIKIYERSNDKFGLLYTKEYDYMDKITVICYNTEAIGGDYG